MMDPIIGHKSGRVWSLDSRPGRKSTPVVGNLQQLEVYFTFDIASWRIWSSSLLYNINGCIYG